MDFKDIKFEDELTSKNTDIIDLKPFLGFPEELDLDNVKVKGKIYFKLLPELERHGLYRIAMEITDVELDITWGINNDPDYITPADVVMIEKANGVLFMNDEFEGNFSLHLTKDNTVMDSDVCFNKDGGFSIDEVTISLHLDKDNKFSVLAQ